MDIDLARGMMAFGADLLKYRCPNSRPNTAQKSFSDVIE
jgi:hypothetical protein